MRFIFFISLVALTACSQQPPQVLTARYLDPEDFNKTAKNFPNKLTVEDIPDGSAGVIFYTTIKGRPHVLFVKYRKDESYGYLLTELDANESFANAALRVAKSGTAGLYKLSMRDLSTSKMYYETQRSGHQVLIFMIYTKELNYTKNLLMAQEFCKDSDCYLSQEFKWIPVRKLLVQSRPIFIADDGKETPLSLQTWASIQQPVFRQILMDIDRG